MTLTDYIDAIQEADDSAYEGFHTRMHSDSNGWTTFEVYTRSGHFYWSACDDWCEHVGFVYGPFTSARKAYRHATAN